MQVVGRQQRPPASEAIDGYGSGSAEHQQAGAVRCQKRQRVHRQICKGGFEHQRDHENCDVDDNDAANQLLGVPEKMHQPVVFPGGTGASDGAVRAAGLIYADELAAVRAEDGSSSLVCHAKTQTRPATLPHLHDHGFPVSLFSGV